MPSTIYVLTREHVPQRPLPMGAYIEDVNGDFFYMDKAQDSSIINSYVIVSKMKNFRILPISADGYDPYTGQKNTAFGIVNDVSVAGVTYVDANTYDYNGEENTIAYVNAFGDSTPFDDSSIYPAKVCYNTYSLNGQRGYLPSSGEYHLETLYSPLIYTYFIRIAENP